MSREVTEAERGASGGLDYVAAVVNKRPNQHATRRQYANASRIARDDVAGAVGVIRTDGCVARRAEVAIHLVGSNPGLDGVCPEMLMPYVRELPSTCSREFPSSFVTSPTSTRPPYATRTARAWFASVSASLPVLLTLNRRTRAPRAIVEACPHRRDQARPGIGVAAAERAMQAYTAFPPVLAGRRTHRDMRRIRTRIEFSHDRPGELRPGQRRISRRRGFRRHCTHRPHRRSLPPASPARPRPAAR